MSPRRRTALVTGASGGIGEEIARVLAARGHDLVVVARSRDKLDALGGELERRHGVRVRAIAADLADPAAPEAVAEAARAAGVDVDILVNNAGIANYGPFAEVSAAADLRLIAVNLTALTHLSKLFLPGMIARRWGRLLNVASTAAFVPGPLMSVYFASKAYILSLSVALSNELTGTGVAVTCLCPGPTRTGIARAAGNEHTRLFQSGHVMDASTVARIGVDAMERGRRIAVPGFANRLQASAAGLVPRAVLAKVARHLQSPA